MTILAHIGPASPAGHIIASDMRASRACLGHSTELGLITAMARQAPEAMK